MADYLDNLVGRILGTASLVWPRPRGHFEPAEPGAMADSPPIDDDPLVAPLTTPAATVTAPPGTPTPPRVASQSVRTPAAPPVERIVERVLERVAETPALPVISVPQPPQPPASAPPSSSAPQHVEQHLVSTSTQPPAQRAPEQPSARPEFPAPQPTAVTPSSQPAALQVKTQHASQSLQPPIERLVERVIERAAGSPRTPVSPASVTPVAAPQATPVERARVNRHERPPAPPVEQIVERIIEDRQSTLRVERVVERDHERIVAPIERVVEKTIVRPSPLAATAEAPAAFTMEAPNRLAPAPIAPPHERSVTKVETRLLPQLPDPAPPRAESSVPSVQVSIGRIEIRATPAPGPVHQPRKGRPVMGLDEYLRQRGRGAP